MWDFFETVRHRHSIHHYRPEIPVERHQLHAILEMACAAPSAGDLQSYRIVVVQDPDQRDAIRGIAEDQAFISQAPVCLVFCAEGERAAARFGRRGRELYAVQDATIAATYGQLAAVAAGLASTWIGYFDEDGARRVLDLDEALRPVAMLSIGYPAELPEPTGRRRLDDIVIHAAEKD